MRDRETAREKGAVAATGHRSFATEPAVHIWILDLDAMPYPDAALQAALDPVDLAHCARALLPREQRRRLVCRAGLRWIVSGYVNQPPAALRFAVGPHGKPALRLDRDNAAIGLHFNLSHSRGLAAIAVTDHAEVGIDIEHIAPLEPGLAASVLSDREQHALRQLPDDARADAFYRSWVRKEAILKATGVGLSVAPTRIEVPHAIEWASASLLLPPEWGDAPDWTLRMFAPRPGVVGSIAIRCHSVEVTIREADDFTNLNGGAVPYDKR